VSHTVVVACGNCGESLSYSSDENWSYCPECGTRLTKSRAKPPKPGERYLYKPRRVFLDSGVAKKECDSCGTVVAEVRQYCPRCGSRFMPDDSGTFMQVLLGRARYLGGCPALGPVRDGGLTFAQSGVLFGAFKLDIALVKSVDVGGGQVAKSKVAATLAFGVVGLATKGKKDRTEVAVHLYSGEAAFFAIEKTSPFEVRAKLLPLLRAAGIPLEDEIDEQAGAPDALADSDAAHGLVAELERLARLHESGFLTAEEVTLAKAKLLRPSEP